MAHRRLGSILLLQLLLALPAARAHDSTPFEFLKPRLTHAEFIDQSFRSVLGRTPSASERAEWLDVLERGSSRWYLFRTLIDSPAHVREVGPDELVVLAFGAVVQRPPTREEFEAFSAYLARNGRRSDLVRALMMSRDFARLGLSPYYLMDDVPLRLHPSLVHDLPSILSAVRAGAYRVAVEPVELPAAPLRDAEASALAGLDGLAEVSGAPLQSAYNDYRGFLHAHSNLSVDARNKGGTPEEAWTMARDQAKLDFMGITDHAEFLGNTRWQQLQDAAKKFNQPGVFIALPGFEHSNPVMGHYCVMNTPDFRSAVERVTVNAFYDWLETQPQAVVTFNHPGSYDFLNVEFNHFKLRPAVAPMVVASEVMHSSLDQYLDGYDGQYSYFDEALLKGWRVGSAQAQDNHSPDYGIRNDTRTVVFASELTIDGLLEGYRSRRIYAVEDKNLYLTFSTSDGHEMGSVIPRGERTFLVGVDDPDNETFTQIDVYENGKISRTQSISTTAGTWSFDVPAADEDRYYYVRVHQQDGDRAQSSPIWLSASATSTAAVR